MRVIAGEFRSRRLKTLAGLELRPTPDRLRESLFSVIADRLPGATFVDAYAGCGSVGIEALSRGAARAIFLEKHRPAVRLIEDNLAALNIGSRAQVVAGPASAMLARWHGDIVFLDPPYDVASEYGRSLGVLGKNPPPLAIAQHDSRMKLADEYGALRRVRLLKQGDNSLSFFEPVTPAP